MNLAKLLISLKNYRIEDEYGLIETLRECKFVNRSNCRWIAIPTTSGTGSEVTPWASVWDFKSANKYTVDDASLFAYKAIIDPKITESLPLHITISTACDTLCHAMEAYWSKSTNEISKVFSLKAIELIAEMFRKIIYGNDLIES